MSVPITAAPVRPTTTRTGRGQCPACHSFLPNRIPDSCPRCHQRLEAGPSSTPPSPERRRLAAHEPEIIACVGIPRRELAARVGKTLDYLAYWAAAEARPDGRAAA